MFRLIESKTKFIFEDWINISEHYKNDKKFLKLRNDKYRLQESIRSNVRTLVAKNRESEIVERRN